MKTFNDVGALQCVGLLSLSLMAPDSWHGYQEGGALFCAHTRTGYCKTRKFRQLQTIVIYSRNIFHAIIGIHVGWAEFVAGVTIAKFNFREMFLFYTSDKLCLSYIYLYL